VIKSEEEVDLIMSKGDAFIVDNEIVYAPFLNMTLEEGHWIYPPNYLHEIKETTKTKIKKFASESRRKIVDFVDEVKLAEYADKAALAPRLIDQTATEIEIESSVNDAWAKNNNITDPIEIGNMWSKRANELRVARNAVNLLETNAYTAIDVLQNPDDINHLLSDLKKQADTALDQLLSVATT
jgi:hypothetical protein